MHVENRPIPADPHRRAGAPGIRPHEGTTQGKSSRRPPDSHLTRATISSPQLLALQKSVGNVRTAALVLQALWIGGGDSGVPRINTQERTKFYTYVMSLETLDSLALLRTTLEAAVGGNTKAAADHERHFRYIATRVEQLSGAPSGKVAADTPGSEAEHSGRKAAAHDDWGRHRPPQKKTAPRQVTKKERKKAAAALRTARDQQELARIAADPQAVIGDVRNRLKQYAQDENIQIDDSDVKSAIAELTNLAREFLRADEAAKMDLARTMRGLVNATFDHAVEAWAPRLAERERLLTLTRARQTYVSKGLNAETAERIVAKAIIDDVDKNTAHLLLRDALDRQLSPSRKTWLKHLGLHVTGGTWNLAHHGASHEGMRIHRTYSNDAIRASGPVTRSADKIMANLFETAPTKSQNHVTLEVPGGDNAHLYWDGTADQKGYIGDWEEALAALEMEMTAWKSEIRTQIERAIKKLGNI